MGTRRPKKVGTVATTPRIAELGMMGFEGRTVEYGYTKKKSDRRSAKVVKQYGELVLLRFKDGEELWTS